MEIVQSLRGILSKKIIEIHLPSSCEYASAKIQERKCLIRESF